MMRNEKPFSNEAMGRWEESAPKQGLWWCHGLFKYMCDCEQMQHRRQPLPLIDWHIFDSPATVERICKDWYTVIKSGWKNSMDYVRNSGIEPSAVIISQTKYRYRLKCDTLILPQQVEAKKGSILLLNPKHDLFVKNICLDTFSINTV